VTDNLRSDISWVGVDWGSSNFRAYALDAERNILDSTATNAGMRVVEQRNYEAVLLQQIQHWLPLHGKLLVLMSGMVGARQGWQEASYKAVPCVSFTASDVMPIETQSQRIRAFIAPGVSQQNPPDVMRGEETQIFGWLEQQPDFTGTVCLPGTHSKWVTVSDGEIKQFRTYITGEMFSLLCEQSVLKHSTQSTEWSRHSFSNAVRESALAQHDAADILGGLFSTRAADLLHGVSASRAKAALSARLIHAECDAALRLFASREETETPIVLIGDAALTELYEEVLVHAKQQVHSIAAPTATLLGLQGVANAILNKELFHA